MVCDDPTVGPVYVMVSHNTKTLKILGETKPGPTFTSDYSFKAVSELPAAHYGGIRFFPEPSPFTDNAAPSYCIVDDDVVITFGVSGTATHEGAGRDFDLHYVCCQAVVNSVLNTYREPIPAGPPYTYFARHYFDNACDYPSSCSCMNPSVSTYAATGSLVLDMSGTNPDADGEPPEEFVAHLLSADDVTPGGTHTDFLIGDEGEGNVWIIQDSCECTRLFTYGAPGLDCSDPNEGIPVPSIQLSTEFQLVGGYPVDSASCSNYYGQSPKVGQSLSNYVTQNAPCAGAEVLLEGTANPHSDDNPRLDLLLGYIDRDEICGKRVSGDFYEGLPDDGLVTVELVVKDEADWGGTACGSVQPAQYAENYATPSGAGKDYEIYTLVSPSGMSTCANAGTFPTQWQIITPIQDGNQKWVFPIEFEGHPTSAMALKKKLRSLRIVAIDDSTDEGPEIVHLEIRSATFTQPGMPTVDVNLGWSRAFRVIILDPRE